jgi:hypothetical protein
MAKILGDYYCYLIPNSVYTESLGAYQMYKGILPLDRERYDTVLNAATNFVYDVKTKKDIGVVSFMSSNWLYVESGWKQELNLQCFNFYDGITIPQLSIPTYPLSTDSSNFKLYSQDSLGRLTTVEGENITDTTPDGKEVPIQVLHIIVYDRPFVIV